MVTLVVRLADLEFLTPRDLGGALSTADIVDAIRKQFDHLPGELHVEVKDGVAAIQFEAASAQKQTEARRLFEKAAKRAKGGEFRKAKDIYDHVLELDPAMADARRELAMTLFELGDMEGAKHQLIDALRLKPDDYRILLSRGLRGAYAWIPDQETRRHICESLGSDSLRSEHDSTEFS